MRASTRVVVLATMVFLGALLTLAPVARAAGETLQVSREVTAALGGDAVTLTATLSKNADTALVINFEAEGGPADKKPEGDPERSCNIAQGARTCTVSFQEGREGTSLIRAYIAGRPVDRAEARLANRDSSLLGLNFAADCQPDDDDPLQNTCMAGTPVNAGSQAEPDSTDVVEITWLTFADARLDCDDSRPEDGEDIEYNRIDDRSETYHCTLLSKEDPPTPIAGAFIDGEKLTGPDANSDPSAADIKDLCTTDGAGRCSGTVTIAGTGPALTDICFWAEPGNNANNVYDPGGSAVDGSDCDGGAEVWDEPEGNDITDTVRLDIDDPRPTRLDAGPEHQVAGPGNRFTFAGVVYDQFGASFKGDTTIYAEYFQDSPLDTDGNTPSTPDNQCQTKNQGGCTMATATQHVLDTNLVCLWIDVPDSPAPRNSEFVGNNIQGACGDEIPTDPTADDGLPFPVTDGRDIIRFTIQSRPLIGSVTPEGTRQDASDLLQIVGANFIQGARIAVSGEGVKLDFTRFVSETALEATIQVDPEAPAGARDVTVTNPDGGTTTCRLCFKVIGQGYWMVASDGGIFGFGDATFAGSTGDRPLNSPIIGMAPTPSGAGYWLAAADGGIFNFGDAPFLGSAGEFPLNQPIVAIASHPTGKGYWLVAADGGIFNFGDARFYGSTGRLRLTQPIVGIAASPTGRGYWLVAADGGLFAFGDARFLGSTGDVELNQPIVTMAATRNGRGYWLVASDGGVFAFGDARFLGSTGDIRLNQPIVGMATTPLVNGYWLVASDGGIFAFGDARFAGSTGDIALNKPIVGMARR